MAEYMGKLSREQNEVLAAMPRRQSSFESQHPNPYQGLLDAMERTVGEMIEASEHNAKTYDVPTARAQHEAARTLALAILNMQVAHLTLHGEIRTE